MDQTYPTWELCLADDGSHDAALTAVLEQYSRRDTRIRHVTLEQNRGISGATNAALSLCTGEYVAFLDHDDELAAFALSAVVQAINDHPDTEIFYSDEDKIDERGRRYDAFFKPDWSPDLFRSCNYICHFVVMKRALAESLGGLDQTYSGSQGLRIPAARQRTHAEDQKDTQDPIPLAGNRRFRRQSAGGKAGSQRGWKTGLGGVSREERAGRPRGGGRGLPLSSPLSHCRKSAGQYSDPYRRPQERLPGAGIRTGKDGLQEL
jgi:hypothetical protein